MAVTWITTVDVRDALGLDPADTVDDAWLAQVTDAANDFTYRRRQQGGYTTDTVDVVPSAAVKTGAVMFAVSLYRDRGALEGSASFSEVGTAFYLPTGGQWGQIKRLLGIPRAAIG